MKNTFNEHTQDLTSPEPSSLGAATHAPDPFSPRTHLASRPTYGRDAITEAIDPEAEDAFWSNAFRTRPYVSEGEEYQRYRSAYRYGWEGAIKAEGESFEESAWWMERDWPKSGTGSDLSWAAARHAVRDAWERITAPYDRRRRVWADESRFTLES